MAGCADGQLRPVRTRTHTQSNDNSSWRDMPSPLHITKRSAVGRGSHGCGSPSETSDTNMDSPPEPLGQHRPLTLPKRRGDRGTWALYHPVGCTRGKGRDLKTTDDRAATPLADDAALKHQRSASCTTSSRQSNSRPSCRSSPSNRSSLSLSGPGEARDGSTHLESTHGGAGPGLPITPEVLEEHNSPRPKPRSNLRPSPTYESDDYAGTLHLPILTDPGGPTGPLSPPHFQDTRVLAPDITVTPEYGTVDEGTVTVWVAVQLSTRICRALALDQAHGKVADDQFAPDALRYGFLYNVSTGLLPAGQSTIVEVLDDKACATVLYPGSRLLFIAHIRLGPAVRYRPRTHVRQKSDDLIEDLEHELGGTVTEYLQIRVRYCHSGFPQRRKQTTAVVNNTAPDGIASIQTTIQTTATATIKRHKSTSPWSAPPCTPGPNRLFEVIASHWGPENAHAVMQRVIRSRAAPSSVINGPLNITLVLEPTAQQQHVQDTMNEHHQPPKRQRTKPRGSQQSSRPNPIPPPSSAAITKTTTAPPVPRRQASLRRVASAYHDDADPARERRRAASHYHHSHHHNHQQQQQQQQQQHVGVADGRETETETETEKTSPAATVRRLKSARDRRGKGGRAVSGFHHPAASSSASVSSSASPGGGGGPYSAAAAFTPNGVVAAGAGYGGESVGSTSASSRGVAGKGAEMEQRRGLDGKWPTGGGDMRSVGDMGKDAEGKGKGSEVGMVVGRGGGSVRTRKGKEKERGWGWSSWWQ